MKLTIRILIFMALAVMLVSSCGNRKGGKNAAPVEPEAVQNVTDRYFEAIDKYFTSEIAPQYSCNALSWCVLLLCPLPDAAMSSARHDCWHTRMFE